MLVPGDGITRNEAGYIGGRIVELARAATNNGFIRYVSSVHVEELPSTMKRTTFLGGCLGLRMGSLLCSFGDSLLQLSHAAVVALVCFFPWLIGIGSTEGGADIPQVCIIVEFFLLTADGNGTYVEIALVVVGSNAGEVDVAVTWIGGGAKDAPVIKLFQHSKVVGGEDELPTSLLAKDPNQLSQQVFKYAVVKFINDVLSGNSRER